MFDDTNIKVEKEINLLRQLLENLGFSLISTTSKSIEQILNEDFIEDLFGVYLDTNNDKVGSCTIINAFNGTIIEITLNLTVPKDKDIVKQLLLLGFKERVSDNSNYGWLRYTVKIHD